MSGHGIWGKTGGGSKAGVVGLANTNERGETCKTGVYGESVGGHGVYARTDAEDKAAIVAENTGDGPALYIDGWIRVRGETKDWRVEHGGSHPFYALDWNLMENPAGTFVFNNPDEYTIDSIIIEFADNLSNKVVTVSSPSNIKIWPSIESSLERGKLRLYFGGSSYSDRELKVNFMFFDIET